MTPRSSQLTAMIAAAHAAGEGLKRDFASLSGLTVSHKGPADLFSEADLKAEETVRAMLADAEPDYGFLGEEGGLSEGADQDNVWVVDPLDGTANFLIGLPIFAVNIALVRRGQVIAGVTHVPMMNETFFAETGGGAWLNDRRIAVSPRQGLINAVLGVGIPFAGKPHQDRFLTEMARLTPNVSGIRRLGAGAVDMAYVACGRLDAYWEQSVSAWDMAAGVVIVREAGGVVTDTLGGDLDIMGGTMLASTPQLHGEMIAAIAPL